ncbi:1-phosphofructokinase family hexose kinase [Corynebacterium terpenotabidum]|uniref:1-phosphofructokinase n=1 Tax=Corynebacterium terpenotabidum Y-11 TaxID=1200352 RepID=S4XL85_9CORY|nr:1-phosphofructokinase family hexose kinase [Corynebacterium terpenotabidum]AGP31353.1 1-phosphofructokinase [Corynebacterium terpenotabidum Y-11]
MIITVTPNPSIDRTQTLDAPLSVGGVNRVISGADQAGGKGVNVATVLHCAGQEVLSVVPAPDDGPFAALVADSQVPTHFIPGSAPARVNLTLVDADGVTTKVNEPGTGGSGAALTTTLGHLYADADRLVLAGSLPPGYPTDWYATVTAEAHRNGLTVAVDTSGTPLTDLVAATATTPAATPDLIKPNTYELAEILGLSPADADAMEDAAARGELATVADAASRLVDRGFAEVLVSLGAAGALLATGDGAWFCPSPRVDAVSTVGAGDSTLAGYVLGSVRGLDPADRLALAVAHGATAVTLPGTTLPRPENLPADLPVARQIR